MCYKKYVKFNEKSLKNDFFGFTKSEKKHVFCLSMGGRGYFLTPFWGCFYVKFINFYVIFFISTKIYQKKVIFFDVKFE